jgi:hypothetical protein
MKHKQVNEDTPHTLLPGFVIYIDHFGDSWFVRDIPDSPNGLWTQTSSKAFVFSTQQKAQERLNRCGWVIKNSASVRPTGSMK